MDEDESWHGAVSEELNRSDVVLDEDEDEAVVSGVGGSNSLAVVVLGGLKLDVVPVGCSGASGVLQVSPEEFMRDVVSGVGVAEPGLRFDEADLPILRPFLLNPGASEFLPLQEENVGYEHHVGETVTFNTLWQGSGLCRY